MKKIKPINYHKFFTLISIKKDSNETLYYDYFSNTIEQIRIMQSGLIFGSFQVILK